MKLLKDKEKTLKIQGFNFIGAGGGNRTLTISLEGWSSTIKLHPQLKYELIIQLIKINVNNILQKN